MLTRMMMVVAAALPLMAMAPRLEEPVAGSDMKAGTFSLTVKDGKVSLNAREAELSRVIESIGDNAGITVKLKGGISGKVTTQFKDVPLRAAFERLAGKRKLEIETAYGAVEGVILKVTLGEDAGGSQKTAVSSGKVTWKKYKNAGWAIACEYPEDWEVKTVVTNPGSPDSVIKEKIEFRGQNGPIFWLDIWTNSEKLGLMEWFKKYLIEIFNDRSNLPKEPNAEIGGEPAVVAINTQTMACKEIITIFERDDLVFNLTYVCSDKLDAKKAYDHLLASFRFEEKGKSN